MLKFGTRSLLLVVAAVLLGTLAAPQAQAQGWEPRQLRATLIGSGATFPNPLYQTWIQVYQDVVPGVSISYEAVGSGQGIRDFVGYLTDFGGTDAAISAERVEREAPDALHVPTVLGAVVPIYNVPELGATTLNFSAQSLAGIYLGSITNWSDDRIAADNPGVALPDRNIIVVRRSDGSGTTSIFTDYLSKVDPTWRETVGAGTTVAWPVGVGAPGNPGVASTVLQTEGGIGYVELIFALANGLSYGTVQNSFSGEYIPATLASVTAAAEGIEYPAEVAVSITNSPNPTAYPIAGFTYFLVRQSTYTDPNKAAALTDFICWSLTVGQGAANRLGYAPLPTQARQLAIGQINKITVDGETVSTCPVQ
jgi:phosphate transport system substrate-binding protein